MANIAVREVGTSPITSAPEHQDICPGGNPALWDELFEVDVTLRNTGGLRGATVAQLHVTLPSSTPPGTPFLQLRGFNKVELAPGEGYKAKFELMRRDISY